MVEGSGEPAGADADSRRAAEMRRARRSRGVCARESDSESARENERERQRKRQRASETHESGVSNAPSVPKPRCVSEKSAREKFAPPLQISQVDFEPRPSEFNSEVGGG